MKLTGYYTTQGSNMAATALANGQSITLTRAVAGSGTTSAEATGLDQVRQNLQIVSKQAENGKCIVQTLLDASLASNDYTLREIGVYAKRGSGSETLYQIFRLDEGLHIEASVDLSITFFLTEVILPSDAVEICFTREGLVTPGSCQQTAEDAAALAKQGAEQTAAQALFLHSGDEDAHSALFAQKAAAQHGHSASEITGGTLAGKVSAQNNTDYSTAQLRNIILSAAEASGGENGQIWLRYEE